MNVQKSLKYVDKVEGYGVGQQVVINNQVNDNKLLETANKKFGLLFSLGREHKGF